jgi:hypothetical protein
MAGRPGKTPGAQKDWKTGTETGKRNHEKKELGFSSYLVQTAPKIVRRISRNQLVKIKGEEAPPELQQTKFK